MSNQVFLYNGNTLVNTFSTIQDAINAASPFETIQIGAGTYDENVVVNKNNLTIENAAGAQVTILGQGGGQSGAINVASGVIGVTIRSSDGVPGNFVLEGSQTTGQVAALYIVGQNDDITINGITTIAPATGAGGLNSVLTGGNLTNVLFENNVFAGTAGQLVYVNGAEDIGPQAQDGFVGFVGNTFSGSAPGGPLLGMDAPGEIINNTFTGSAAVDIGVGEGGVTVTGNSFNNTPTDGYFLGNGAYDPQTIETSNSFAAHGAIYIVQNGVRQDGVYSSIQAAINAAITGDTIMVGAGTYHENVIVNVANLTIEGYNGPVTLQGTFKSDNGIANGGVMDFLELGAAYSQAAGRGFDIEANNVTLQNLNIDGFTYGVNLGNGTSVIDGATLDNVAITDSLVGIHKGTTSAITNFAIFGGSMSDGLIGIDFDIDTSAANYNKYTANGVTIDGTAFSDYAYKGIYAETLSNADINGITMEDVGQYGAPSTSGPVGTSGDGIDLNLKNGSYSNITIESFNLDNVGASNENGAQLTGDAHGGAIVVEARDFGSYANAKGTVTNPVVIKNGTIEGTTSTGI